MSDNPIPPNSAIIREAVELLEKERPGTPSGESDRVSFPDYVEMLSEAAYETYEKHVAEAREAIASKRAAGLKKDRYSRDEMVAILREVLEDMLRVNEDGWWGRKA